jgi:hypothetical protein
MSTFRTPKTNPMAELSIDEGRLNAVVMERLSVFHRGFTSRVATTARGLAPERSGALKAAIREDPQRRSGPWTIDGGVSVDVPYAAAVHEGARPHVIRARRAPFLRFYWPKVGRVVFFKSVNHPGNAPNPFLTNAGHRVASEDPRITFTG